MRKCGSPKRLLEQPRPPKALTQTSALRPRRQDREPPIRQQLQQLPIRIPDHH
jgi:hypothetical protein